MAGLSSTPHRLDINCIPVYYAGGAKISKFRGGDEPARGPRTGSARPLRSRPLCSQVATLRPESLASKTVLSCARP